jgi:class 3 adenylate cyclase
MEPRVVATQVTLFFCDIARSTELIEQIGDQAAYTAIRHFFDVTHDHTLLCGGEALELRGDGALIAFPAPNDALPCVVSLQRSFSGDERLAIRMGIHTGWPLRVEGYFGSAVVTAARLADRARPREILLSADVCAYARDSVALRLGPRRRIRLKGFLTRGHRDRVALARRQR